MGRRSRLRPQRELSYSLNPSFPPWTYVASKLLSTPKPPSQKSAPNTVGGRLLDGKAGYVLVLHLPKGHRQK